MNSIELVVIPVYLHNRATFEEKYRRRYVVPYLNQYSPADLESTLIEIGYPRNIWRFNQIVGYAIIHLDKYDDQYEISIQKWLLQADRIGINSRKDRIRPVSSIGDHFVVSNWNNKVLATKIKSYIENDNIFTNRHIDYDAFDRFMRIIDFSKLRLEIR